MCILIDFDHVGDKGQTCVASLKEFATPPKIIGFGDPAINHSGCDAFLRFPFEGPVLLVTVARLMGMQFQPSVN